MKPPESLEDIMRNLEKMSSKKIYEYADELWNKTVEFVRAPSGYPLKTTPELEAFAKREADRVREKIRAVGDERAKQEAEKMANKSK